SVRLARRVVHDGATEDDGDWKKLPLQNTRPELPLGSAEHCRAASAPDGPVPRLQSDARPAAREATLRAGAKDSASRYYRRPDTGVCCFRSATHTARKIRPTVMTQNSHRRLSANAALG